MSVLTKIRQKGILNSIEIVFNRVVPAWLFRFSIGDVFELDGEKLVGSPNNRPNRELDFRIVTDPDERVDLRATTWNSVPLETTHNDFGFGIVRADQPSQFLGGVWGGVESFVEQNLGFQIQLQPHQGWIYCAYIDNALRGQKAYQRLLSFGADHLKDQGHEQLFVIIQPWNHVSIHVHRKYSKRRIGRVAVIRIFGTAAVMTTGTVTRNKTITTKIETSPVLIEVSSTVPNRASSH